MELEQIIIYKHFKFKKEVSRDRRLLFWILYTTPQTENINK